jgi:hypothetical protein
MEIQKKLWKNIVRSVIQLVLLLSLLLCSCYYGDGSCICSKERSQYEREKYERQQKAEQEKANKVFWEQQKKSIEQSSQTPIPAANPVDTKTGITANTGQGESGTTGSGGAGGCADGQ